MALLLPLQIPESYVNEKMLQKIHDDFENPSTGYSFLNNHKNHVIKNKSKEVTRQLCSRFNTTNNDAIISWLKRSET